MSIGDFEMVQAWKQVLHLSKLKRGETVTILTSVDTHAQTLQTATMAARDMGAIVNRLDLPPVNGEKSLSRDALAYVGTTPLTGSKAAMALLKESDLVLDLMLLFSPEQAEILESGTRMLLAVEPPEVLARLVPTEADRARVLRASARLRAAREMHVTSEAGTDIRFRLGQYPMLEEYGFVDRPGRWDHWPSGFLATWPAEGQSNGTIVLDRGDILLPQKCYLQNQIRPHLTAADILPRQDIVYGQDRDIVETQRPERIPVDLREEMHHRTDRMGVAHRRFLAELGVRYGTA